MKIAAFLMAQDYHDAPEGARKDPSPARAPVFRIRAARSSEPAPDGFDGGPNWARQSH